MAPAIIQIPILSAADLCRFEKYLKRDPVTGCLLWIGCRNRHRYGRLRLGGADGQVYLAHRVAFVLGGGVITEERPHVLHNCPHGDEPACCEFAHLWAGTQQDNMRDSARKNRGRKSKKGMPYGVSPNHDGFMARIQVAGQPIYLGTYGSIEMAAKIAREAKEETP